MWLPDLQDNSLPTYLALVEAIAAAIGRGELKPGERLPPQRRLAWTLGINPSTVMLAYREAARRHLVSGEVGRGTYVLASSHEASLFRLKQPAAQGELIDLSTNVPVHDPDNRDLSTSLAALAARGELDALHRRMKADSERLLFEARKDVITYVSILAVFLLARQLVARPMAAPPPPIEDAALIEVRDGNRVVMLRPREIDWVSAAGNYVELHGSFGSLLARRTMADLVSELTPYGFVRVHRSHLVRRTAIATTETRQSGDFDITLRSGAVISGSRRFRQNLA